MPSNAQYLPLPEEKRSAFRRKVNLAASICIGGSGRLACRVVDISPMGAGIELLSPGILPATFRLVIPIDLFSVDCELRHQNGRIVGVEFTSHRPEAMARYS